MLDDGKEKPQCVLCYTVFSNEAMKPSKLKCHSQTKHPKHVEKDLNFFERQKLLLKQQKLEVSGYFQEQSTANLTAFLKWHYKETSKKPHNIEKTLVNPCAVNRVKLI